MAINSLISSAFIPIPSVMTPINYLKKTHNKKTQLCSDHLTQDMGKLKKQWNHNFWGVLTSSS